MDYAEIYNAIGLSARGRIGKLWIHKQYSAFKVVTKYYYPENPRSGDQQGWRSVFYDAVYNWRGFDESTKNFYNVKTRPKRMSGYNRYLRLYLEANYPMIIYWGSLEKSATDPALVPDYIGSDYFTAGLYPAAKKKLLALPSSGDLVLPGSLKVAGDVCITKQPCVAARMSADQTIAHGVPEEIDFDTEDFDLNGEFDTTGHRFTAKKAGKYFISCSIQWYPTTIDKKYEIFVYINGAQDLLRGGVNQSAGGGRLTVGTHHLVDLAVDGYLEFVANHNSLVNRDIIAARSYLSIFRVA